MQTCKRYVYAVSLAVQLELDDTTTINEIPVWRPERERSEDEDPYNDIPFVWAIYATPEAAEKRKAFMQEVCPDNEYHVKKIEVGR